MLNYNTILNLAANKYKLLKDAKFGPNHQFNEIQSDQIKATALTYTVLKGSD